VVSGRGSWSIAFGGDFRRQAQRLARVCAGAPMPTMARPASRRREEILDALVLALLAVAVLCAIA